VRKRLVACLGVTGIAWSTAPAVAADADAIARGAYLAAVAGCEACHTDASNNRPAFAGGRALKTSIGTFYTPNISPDPQFGIGTWSDADFLRALRKGVSPNGADYFPAFPYASFTLLKDTDILDIKAFLFSRPAVPQPNKPHKLDFPYSMRLLIWPWKALYFRAGPYQDRPGESAEWNRGAYLVEGLAHCGECHTPRNAWGALDQSRRFAGVSDAPDITQHARALGSWSRGDIETYLKDGVTPNGDFVGPAMKDVVAGTSKFAADDLAAVSAYLKSPPPGRP
jgi:mono/diheme cytochrome c family protein